MSVRESRLSLRCCSWRAPFPAVGSVPFEPVGHPRAEALDLAQASPLCPRLEGHVDEPVAHDGADFAAFRRAAAGLVFNECSGWVRRHRLVWTISSCVSGRTMVSPGRHQPSRCKRTPCGSSWLCRMCFCRACSLLQLDWWRTRWSCHFHNRDIVLCGTLFSCLLRQIRNDDRARTYVSMQRWPRDSVLKIVNDFNPLNVWTPTPSVHFVPWAVSALPEIGLKKRSCLHIWKWDVLPRLRFGFASSWPLYQHQLIKWIHVKSEVFTCAQKGRNDLELNLSTRHGRQHLMTAKTGASVYNHAPVHSAQDHDYVDQNASLGDARTRWRIFSRICGVEFWTVRLLMIWHWARHSCVIKTNTVILDVSKRLPFCIFVSVDFQRLTDSSAIYLSALGHNVRARMSSIDVHSFK